MARIARHWVAAAQIPRSFWFRLRPYRYFCVVCTEARGTEKCGARYERSRTEYEKRATRSKHIESVVRCSSSVLCLQS